MAAGGAAGLTARTAAALAAMAHGRSGGSRFAALMAAGPAVVASVAYMDPGNFATNIQAGASYGTALLWVVLCANLIAMLFQALSAKLGIATGCNLAEHCRDGFPPGVVLAMWGVSEVAAMATDLAEFLGGAYGLSLLLHLPLLAGMIVTALATYALLLLDRGGFRPIELLIGALVAVIALCYVAELVLAPVAWAGVLRGSVTPRLPDGGAVTVAVGIIGATVMPHAIYLHSGLTQNRVAVRDAAARARLVRWSNREVVTALALAGAVNMAMVILAAAAFNRTGHTDVVAIDTAYRVLAPLLGAAAAGVFLVSLLASGVSSSVVGTMAGQMIMQGFLHRRLPVWLRRLVTVVPAFVVVGLGVDATRALILSQVVLSFALPVPMVSLVIFTGRRALMGPLANGPLTQAAAVAATALVLALNVLLLLTTLGAPVPGLPTG